MTPRVAVTRPPRRPDAAHAPSALRFAGLPLARWLFATRVIIAMMLALYVAFWLQFDGASSAATCVAILALTTRGQTLEKAAYRSAATVIGVTASLVLTGLLSQARDLYLVAYAGWLGVCVFAANLADGNRAYGAILSGYTVAIVAVEQIEKPQQVFSAGVNRGAAIAVGIAAVALVGDLLASPSLQPKVIAELEAARRKVLAFVGRTDRSSAASGAAGRDEAACLLGSIVALHPEVDALAAEGPGGSDRAAAARMTVAALASAVFAARSARTAPSKLDALEAQTAQSLDDLAGTGLGRSERGPRLPLRRSRLVAAAKGAQVALAVALSGMMLVHSSFPDTYITLSLVGIVAGLGSTSPDFRAFSRAAVIAIPVAAAVSGLILFVVLDGVDQFPLLCLAMAPPVMAAALAASSPNPKLKGLGTLVMVFLPVFVAPSNPQKYDALGFLNFSLLATLATLLLSFWLALLPGIPVALRRRWLLQAAEADLGPMASPREGSAAGDAAFRAAARIAALSKLGVVDDSDRRASLERGFQLADERLDHEWLGRHRPSRAGVTARPTDGAAE